MKNEMEELMLIVQVTFGVEIMKKVRQRKNVNAKRVFSLILRERGHTVTSIGNFLKLDHSTIVHYMRDTKWIISHEGQLMDKYIECKKEFLKDKPYSLAKKNPKEIERKIYELNNRIEELTLEKNIALQKLENISRLMPIINLIQSKTPAGEEKFIQRAINSMFNGIDYGKKKTSGGREGSTDSD